jgi:SAM-dependent methyltransferase
MTSVTAAMEYSLENIPLTYGQIVEEIAGILPLPRATIEHRVWMEALQLGWNVGKDAQRFGVTSHEYGPQMERLYRESDGFIFETLVFWATPLRRSWIGEALDRMHKHAHTIGVRSSEMRVLIFGDGAGNDSLFLAENGFHVDYFDVPGSVTYDFALKRFRRRCSLGKEIRVLGAYEDCLSGDYDAVVSFEVLEHLPDPRTAIRDLASVLKTGGIALVTESFGYCLPSFPTHLRSNLRFAGKTPFLFLSNGMRLSWQSREVIFRPMEFMRLERSCFRDFLGLVKNREVRRAWRVHRFKALKRAFLPLGGER